MKLVYAAENFLLNVIGRTEYFVHFLDSLITLACRSHGEDGIAIAAFRKQRPRRN